MIFFILVFIFYTLFISISIIGSLINIDSSHTIKDFNSSNDKLLTIIVPFRNEEIRINTLLSSLENQYNYKCIDQIIFVDDHSSDKSFEIIKNWTFNKNFNFKILSLSSDFGKKKAIDLGINNSNSEYIMTIDADVSFNYLFFSELKDKLASNSDLYLTSVIENNGLFISKISSFVISIISIGMANLKSPILVNGAGLIFRKSIYDKLQPFSSNFHISSGDDMFLLKSFIKNGNSVNTISGNSLTILTEGPSSFKSFLLRSLRWSGKMKKSGILISNLLGLLIVFCNLSLFPLAFFVWRYSNNIALFLMLFKLTMDTSILLIASIRYKDYSQLKYLFLMFFIYPFVLALVTILNIINYDSNWKGRKVNSA